MCIAQTYLSIRMTTIGTETGRGYNQKQHEYLSRLIYIFLLQIFTDRRWRTIGSKWRSAMETSRRERERKRSVTRCWTLLRCRGNMHARVGYSSKRKYVSRCCEKRNVRRRVKYALLNERISLKRRVDSRWISQMRSCNLVIRNSVLSQHSLFIIQRL